MKKALAAFFILVLLIGIAALGWYVLWPERLTPEIARDVDVDLSLSGVTLSQGKDGRKLWNLNATGADYAEDGDELTLNAPVITYWGEDGGEPIRVTAPKGQVWQKEDRARMWDGVNATQGEYSIRADAMDYLGQNRTLVLTGDIGLEGDAMWGRADILTYFLDTGDFLAQGNVQVTLN